MRMKSGLRPSSDLARHSQISSISQHTHSASDADRAAAGTAGAGLIHAAVTERKATADVCLDAEN